MAKPIATQASIQKRRGRTRDIGNELRKFSGIIGKCGSFLGRVEISKKSIQSSCYILTPHYGLLKS